MTDEIAGLLDGTDKSAGWGLNAATLLAERYMAGHGIAVSGRIGVQADLERLVDLDEAWALCVRVPRPGWRLLGRFVDVNVFVAAAAHDRALLGDIPRYTAAAQAMLDAWRTNLPAVHAVSFASPTDYLTGVLFDADATH